MHRRSFLAGLGTLALTQGLGGCQSNSQQQLETYFLRSTVPSQLFNQFRSQLSGANLKLDPLLSLEALFERLQSWRRELGQPSANASGPLPVRTLSLGNFWLSQAIRQQLIQPLNLDKLTNWSRLPLVWQSLVTRDRQGNLADISSASSDLQVWGAPYRWGMTVIVYRKDKFAKLGWAPQDWSDLWRPELQGKLSLLNQPREVIGLTLKRLGSSYNIAEPAGVEGIQQALKDLNRQVRFYSSDAYIQPLLLEDTWAAVGWSTDVLPEVRQDDRLAIAVPKAGTSLWADVWVQPNQNGNLDDPSQKLLNRWLDFWWQPEVVNQLSQYSDALSPLAVSGQTPGRTSQLLLPNADSFARHEFLNPLADKTITQLRSLWQDMRKPI
jgi:putative spermidine/putrescine transport system substrate-binding protein